MGIWNEAEARKRFEDAVGQACENAAARRVAKQFGLAESTVRGYMKALLAKLGVRSRIEALAVARKAQLI